MRQGIAASGASSRSVGVQVVKDPQQAIPASAWALLSETERHRQHMLYGIIYSEFIYNKHLWALTQVRSRVERERVLTNNCCADCQGV